MPNVYSWFAPKLSTGQKRIHDEPTVTLFRRTIHAQEETRRAHAHLRGPIDQVTRIGVTRRSPLCPSNTGGSPVICKEGNL